MLIPKHFAQNDCDKILAFIAANPLATLISYGENGLQIAHVPMALHQIEQGETVLLGHCNRANPIVKNMHDVAQWQAVFAHGGHYISPNWYPNKAITHKEVPTWNYQAVHIVGRLTILDNAAAVLAAQTDFWEARLPENRPWQLQDAPNEFIERMSRAIVCFQLHMETVEAQFKLSQNKDLPTRQNIMTQLRHINTPAAQYMADCIEREQPIE